MDLFKEYEAEEYVPLLEGLESESHICRCARSGNGSVEGACGQTSYEGGMHASQMSRVLPISAMEQVALEVLIAPTKTRMRHIREPHVPIKDMEDRQRLHSCANGYGMGRSPSANSYRAIQGKN